jgi:hypothetical protein
MGRQKGGRPSAGECLWKEGRTYSASWTVEAACRRKGNVEEEGSVEEGVGAQKKGFVVQQPNTYEAERNKHVAKIQE